MTADRMSMMRSSVLAAEALGEHARDPAIDLIVLGSRGRTGLTRALLGSVTRDVVTSTQASVLVVRSAP